MKAIPINLNWPGNKYWSTIQIAVLVAIFGYLFAENFILSESWEVLTLRSIDDYAIQDSIHSMQIAIISGDWKRVFGFFDYAYGNAFWLINAILLLPLYFIGDAQSLIVAGRQISLIFVFGSVYLVGLIIERMHPDARQLKYPVLIAIATMPMVTIISTKYHVNAQCLFLGLLSFYFLVREPVLKKRDLIWSGVFAGMAVGFKLTGIFMVPLLAATLITKLLIQINVNKFKYAASYFIILFLTAAVSTAPALLLFPFYINELSATYKTFLLFKNMASDDTVVTATLLIDAFQFYLSPLSLLATLFFFVVLVVRDVKKHLFFSLYILGAIVSSTVLIIIVTHKGAIYIATYLLSLGFFLPLGILGVSVPRIPIQVKYILAYCIVIAGLGYGYEYRSLLLAPYNFGEMIKNEKTKRQLLALDEIRRLVYPLKLPVRVLQDSSAIFPATRFTNGVYVAINYGDLKEKSTWETFDYILLNSKDYYGKHVTTADQNRDISLNKTSGADLEEATRETLRSTGEFYGRKYHLIYDGYDSLLYKLESE